MERFLSALLAGRAGHLIASVYLFGSLLRGDAEEESDIDLLIVALREPDAVRDEAASVALDVMLDCGERVEPIVITAEEFAEGRGYFLREILKDREEVYRMNEEEIRREEARNFLLLALEYLDDSKKAFSAGSLRLSLDGAYNAAELCLKGFLRLKGREIPRRHGGILSAFSEEYVKSGLLPRELGRKLNRALEMSFRVMREDVEEVLSLAEELCQLLEEKL